VFGDGVVREWIWRMARQRRIQLPGLIRHVMSRGNGRMHIFLDDVDYRHFVYLLGDVVEEYNIECWNYCAMPNHYHATLRPRAPNLSDAVKRLNSVYAQWWNRRHAHVGHVFQGRFKDQVVQREGYLQALCRYVALNPVRAGLVPHPSDWAWSSYAATVGVRPVPAFLAVSSVLAQFGGNELPTMQRRFAEFVLDERVEECTDDRIRSSERILGDGSFKKAVRAESSAP
jgi:putative transposase